MTTQNPAQDVSAKSSDLAALVRKLIRQHGSLRIASKALGLGHVYLHRLATGAQANPSDAALQKLGITRTVRTTYAMEKAR